MKTVIRIAAIVGVLAGTLQGAGTLFSALVSGGGEDFATSVVSDSQGNTYVAGLTYSPDFPVTAGAFQTTFGQTCDAFAAKLGPDGKVIWATYLGGILDDFATGIALDSAGNVLVTGYTRSANFPLANPIQNTQAGWVTFVTKLDPTGSRQLYSTFLGGQGETGAAGIAVDSAGNAYIASNSLNATGYPGIQNAANQSGILVSKLTPQGALTYSYFHPNGLATAIALDGTGAAYVAGSFSKAAPVTPSTSFGPAGLMSAMVFKLAPDGSKRIYESALGGSVEASASALAVANSGEVYLAGNTASVDFPLVHPLQSTLGTRPLWKSTNSGTAWTPLDALPFAIPQVLVADPTAPNTLYAGTQDLGVFKSVDGGTTWTQSSSGIPSANIQVLAIDPVHPQTLYAAAAPVNSSPGATSSSVVYKSVDGAKTWSSIDTAAYLVGELLVDPLNPNNLYQVYSNQSFQGPYVRRSTDAGATWSNAAFPGPAIQSLVLDPNVSGVLIAATYSEISGPSGIGINMPPSFYRSTDGGVTWKLIQSVVISATPGLVIDGSTKPSTVYDGLAYRSTDAGLTWSPLTSSPASANTTALTVDSTGALYAASDNGMFVSHDHAQTWTAIGSPVYPYIASIVAAGSSGTLYTLIKNQTGSPGSALGIDSFLTGGAPFELWSSGFVSKLSADGATLEYSTYLRGHPAPNRSPITVSEPTQIQMQNWISGIALDASGNIVVTGGTHSTDFPTANPVQTANGGLSDAFVASLAADGSKLNYSTYLGGSKDDGALALALDPQGNIVIAGQTWSGDFPLPGAPQLPYTYGDAFVVKIAPPAPPAITAVLNGASYQPGIEAGSWVMITGTGLANTNPGRIWNGNEVVNGNLPTSLDGVSVTIDGKPAFVYYISPTQINVQAPSDSATGTVSVVVNNNGALSAPATAQLQAVAPAFFTYLGTSYAVASRLPDYAAEGNPGTPVKPGDTVVLWGTGFGATTPAVAPGTTVTGAPVAATPTVTLGGTQVQVISSLLTAGSAGLYQVTIQLPATLPTGALTLLATVGNTQTASGILLYVGQ